MTFELSAGVSSRSGHEWAVSVETSPARIGPSLGRLWRRTAGESGQAPASVDGDLESHVAQARALRLSESLAWRAESAAGGPMDGAIYRAPEGWLVLCRRSAAGSGALARLALVYSALARSRDAVIFTDATGTMLGASARWLELYGFCPGDVLGTNVRRINSHQHPRSFFREMFEQLNDPALATWSGELINRGQKGDLVHVSQTITTFFDDAGLVAGYLAITRDLTGHRDLRERLLRTNEELTERLRDQDQLISMTVHDLRSPLQAALGYVDLALQDLEARSVDRAATRLERAHAAGQRMETLIRSLLDAQASRAGRLELSPSRVWVSALLRSEVELHRVHAARKGITIELEQTGPSLPGIFDELRLGEALSNVVVNAIKFSPPGSVLEVRLASSERGEHEIVVDDPGPGIPPEEREAVFDLYFQSRRAQPSGMARQGSGWGLFIARRIIELHGGSIEALESPSGGCRIRMRFASMAGLEEQRPWAAAVVDPDEGLWPSLSALLRDKDLPAFAAHSANELRQLLATERPNLVFAPDGWIELAALVAAARVPATGAERAVFLMAGEGREVRAAAGGSALVRIVRSWFESAPDDPPAERIPR